MSSFRSPSGVEVKVFPYEGFKGIDTSRDKGSMDSGEQQHLIDITNGYVDWRGTIIKDPEVERRSTSEGVIAHVAFFGQDLAAWAVKDGESVSLDTDKGHKLVDAFAKNAVVTSTVFNKRVIMASRGSVMKRYDGSKWEENESQSKPTPAYITAISGRLAMAGLQNSETEVWFSRVDDDNIMPDDEDPAALQVTKAVKLDIRNLTGTSEIIKGLGVFEQDILAIFCQEQTIMYQTNADYTQFRLADRSNIKVGTISHNTIARANTDLLFCSRSGVHTVNRSRQNGITVYQQLLSAKVEDLYKALYKSVPNPEEISAYYDQDKSQYHIFFPQTDFICKRLTITFSISGDDEPKWSMGDFVKARCGARLGGVHLIGTSGGIYRVGEYGEKLTLSPEMSVTTPILWHGSITEIKMSHAMLLQAIGTGYIEVEAFNHEGQRLSTFTIELDESQGDGTFLDVPLPRQYERKFEHKYKGVQFRFTSKGGGTAKIVGFAVFVRSQQ